MTIFRLTLLTVMVILEINRALLLFTLKSIHQQQIILIL